MPTYTYQCEDGHKFDVTKSIKEWSPTAECETCGKTANQIHESTYTGIVFNTDGFYATDWKNK